MATELFFDLTWNIAGPGSLSLYNAQNCARGIEPNPVRKEELIEVANMMQKSDISTSGDTGALRVATLVSICVIALATATALPVGLGDHGMTVKAAYAGNGNGYHFPLVTGK